MFVGSQEFLSAFTKVKDALDTVYNDVVSIDSEVRGMTMHLQATRAQTYQLIEHTTQLQAQRFGDDSNFSLCYFMIQILYSKC